MSADDRSPFTVGRLTMSRAWSATVRRASSTGMSAAQQGLAGVEDPLGRVGLAVGRGRDRHLGDVGPPVGVGCTADRPGQDELAVGRGRGAADGERPGRSVGPGVLHPLVEEGDVARGAERARLAVEVVADHTGPDDLRSRETGGGHALAPLARPVARLVTVHRTLPPGSIVTPPTDPGGQHPYRTHPRPHAELDDRFSEPDATARPWSEVLAVIEAAEISWISTVRPDGRPHVTPLPVFWLDGALHFCTGPGGAEGPQPRRRPAVRHHHRHRPVPQRHRRRGGGRRGAGDRHGRPPAARADVAGEARLGVRRRARRGLRRPRAPTAHLAHVFAVRPQKVLAFGMGEPYSQTRYRFA